MKPMAKVGAKRAAELTGKSKSTIQRAMNGGKISYELDNNGRRVVDVSELERAYGLNETEVSSSASSANAAQEELKRASDLLEIERLKMRIKTLEEQLNAKEDQVEDMRSQRDQWQKQAQQVLLTSQYSQRQAEEYKAEIQERNRRVEAKRQKMMKDRMSRLKGQNNNITESQSASKKTEGQRNISQSASAEKEQSANEPEQNTFWSKVKKKMSA